jgi:hypothetical protein
MSKKPPNAPKAVDPDAEPTEEERASAEALRRALEGVAAPGGADADEDAALAGRLRAAWAPPPIDPEAHQRILAAALGEEPRSRSVPRRLPVRGARITPIVVGAAAALALAAGVAVVVRTQEGAQAPAAEPALAVQAVAVSRSTQPLFADRFPQLGGQSSRIDRIALARASDLRDNEFSRWGVR